MSQHCYCLKQWPFKEFFFGCFFKQATYQPLVVKLIGNDKSGYLTSIIEYHSTSKKTFGEMEIGIYLPFHREVCLCSWAFCHSTAVSSWSGSCIPKTATTLKQEFTFCKLLNIFIIPPKLFVPISFKTLKTFWKISKNKYKKSRKCLFNFNQYWK